MGDFEAVNMNGSGFAFNFDSFAGEFVEGYAIFFDGRDHGG